MLGQPAAGARVGQKEEGPAWVLSHCRFGVRKLRGFLGDSLFLSGKEGKNI